MNKETQKVIFSSKNTDWETPPEVFNALNDTYNFTLDVCATKENTKCEHYFSPEDDALTKDWGGETCFMNPPYGREIGKWVKKAYEESKKPNTTVVCLLPARTDTRWFWDYVMDGDGEITFIKGRIKFMYKGKRIAPAPFPSMIVMFKTFHKLA
jgi:site-specific DNA-methyltransferase (adenine-specific)